MPRFVNLVNGGSALYHRHLEVAAPQPAHIQFLEFFQQGAKGLQQWIRHLQVEFWLQVVQDQVGQVLTEEQLCECRAYGAVEARVV